MVVVERTVRNSTALEYIRSSNNEALDTSAFDKSLNEKARGVLLGPFEVEEDIGLGPVSLVPRRGIWELHGGATEAYCTVIDDLLFGDQNSIVERFPSHRPTNVDGLATQVRAVAHRFPRRPVSGWPGDFSKAYKQVPGDPAQLRYVVVAQWCPTRRRRIMWVALSQLFAGPSLPFFFSR